MTDRTVAPTQAAFLELQEERAGLQEGYRFLDEKRLILAAAILKELADYETLQAEFDRDWAAAAVALREAVARHGPEALACYPPLSPVTGDLRLTPRPVLGVTVNDLDCRLAPAQPPAEDPLASPEARECALAFRALLPRLAQLAVLAGNLDRLQQDYARTARRARALEDVLLPELAETLATVESALEEAEREESVRARHGR